MSQVQQQLSLLLDIVFKMVFSEHPELLMDLLNSCLAFAHTYHIRELEILNPGVYPEEANGKNISLDIQAVDQLGRKYDIEMQSKDLRTYEGRSVIYLSRLCSKQLSKGQDYDQVQPTIGVHFMNYVAYPLYQEFYHHFTLNDNVCPGLCYTEKLHLFAFELKKFHEEKYRYQDIIPACEDMTEWLIYLNNAHDSTERSMKVNRLWR